ncbi:MAG: hypothetical protein H6Q90_2517 [Deltaproteobacteria bacterium]|nr:hypothetical protein [Deltaproteobacteria bacterium]
MKISQLATIASTLLISVPAFADIPTPGGGGGCTVGGADVATSLAGLGVFGLGYVALAVSRRIGRKGK